MFRFLLTLVVGWSLSSWVLTETFFFFPELEGLYATVEESITIPRHDEWDLARFEEEGDWLDTAISLDLRAASFQDLFAKPAGASSQKRSVQDFSNISPILFKIADRQMDLMDDASVAYNWAFRTAKRS